MSDQREGIVGVVGTRADGCEVVCTLPESSAGERYAMVKREILPHVLATRRIADGFQLEFPLDPAIRRKLERWAELEGICCEEASFEIDESSGYLRLTVHGIDPAASAVSELLDSAAPAPRANPIARVAAAGGVGAVGAFLVLCVLPMGLIAVAGASLAGPLAKLESPPALAVGTLAIGGGWWWWRRRGRKRETARRGADCGC